MRDAVERYKAFGLGATDAALHRFDFNIRNGGFYFAGTRIRLAVAVYDFQDGCSADAIFEAYPSDRSRKSMVRSLLSFNIRRKSKPIWKTKMATTMSSRPISAHARYD